MNSNLKLKIIVFFLLVVACDKLDAQAMHYEWAKGIGGVKDAAGISIALDAAGNLYTTGFFADTVDFDPGSGVFNLIAVGIYDIFILKQDPQGNFLWAKSFGGSGDDRSSSIVLNGLGNIYATGFFSDTADFDPNVGIYPLISNGVSDIFVLKLNNMGNLLWAKAMGSSYDDAGEGMTRPKKSLQFRN